MKGVRWREEGWEGLCEACLDWWPLELDFWAPRYGTRKCKACHRDANRLVNRDYRRRQPPVKQDVADLARRRAYYAANIEARRLRQREAYARRMADPMYREERYATMRAYYIARQDRARNEPDKIREYNREWMRDHRRKAA